MAITHDPSGDILQSRCQTLVCPVNVVGIMGKGLAEQMSVKYSGLFYNYRKACLSGLLTINTLWVYPLRLYKSDKQVLCFPTKQHWKPNSKLEWIEANLKTLATEYEEMNIKSIAIPMLGCGEGKLDWEKEVRPLIHKYLGKLPIPITVYGP